MLVVSARGFKSKTGSGKNTSCQDIEETDAFEMSKENILNCSPYSLFQRHSGQGSAEHVRTKAGAGGKATTAPLHPRKRSLSESRLSAPPSTSRVRELTPPELTTSDNFKPAKRVLGPKPALDEKRKVSVKVGLPSSPVASSSGKMMLRLSVPVDDQNFDSRSTKGLMSTNKNSSTRKSSLTGRRLSVVRLGHSKEKGLSVSPKDAVKETMKKVMVFSANKFDQCKIPHGPKEVEKVRSGVTEKKAARSPVPAAKPPSNTVKPVAVVKDESATKMRVVARQSGSTKAIPESTITRKLSIVLQSEQRLQELNQRLELQRRHLQEELLQKDHEIERLRNACLILNNLAKNHSDEVRDLKFRLKKTFNENVEVRDICEKLEKERQEEQATRKKEKEDLNNIALETKLASITTQLQNTSVGLPQVIFEIQNKVQEYVGSETDAGHSTSERPPGAGTFRKWSEVTEEVTEDVSVCRHPEVPLKQEMSAVGNHEELLAAIRAVQDVHDAEDNEGPVISNHEDVHDALQDLQEIISQEETCLKERCADALKALNMPLSPLLTSQGVLDVDSLKGLIVSVSSRGTEFSTHRFNSIFRF